MFTPFAVLVSCCFLSGDSKGRVKLPNDNVGGASMKTALRVGLGLGIALLAATQLEASFGCCMSGWAEISEACGSVGCSATALANIECDGGSWGCVTSASCVGC